MKKILCLFGIIVILTGCSKKVSNDTILSVSKDNKIYVCKPRGKLRNDNVFLKVGDYVSFDDKNNYILEQMDRTSDLERPSVANIDQAFIITSLKNPSFSSNLLDKLLVVCEINNIKPIICLTKKDLLDKSELKSMKPIVSYYKSLGYKVLYNKEKFKIKKLFKNKTTVFTGQTGAGKSTLINKLDKKLNLETGEISKALGRGKHTTRHVELIELFGGKVLDTPGFSSLDFSVMTKENIRDSFREFKTANCPFKDCFHINESECRVKRSVKTGNILESRYDNYVKFLNSSR